jgi:hypothetical protein
VLLLALAGLWFLVSAGSGSVESSGAGRVDFRKFLPVRVGPNSVAYKLAGIAPSSVRRAYLRLGNRRQKVSKKRVRWALLTERRVRIRRKGRLERAPRAGLVIAYRVPDFFVSVDGSDSNPGTEAKPFLSLNTAYQVAAPGDHVAVKGGTYPDTPSIAHQATKTSPAPVLFEAIGQVRLAVADPVNPFEIAGDHLAFRGRFEFDRVFLVDDSHDGSDHITFRGTHIHSVVLCGSVDDAGFYNNRFGPNQLWGYTGPNHTGAGDDIFDSFYCHDGGFNPEHTNTNLRIVGNQFDGAYRSWDGSHSDCIQFTLGAAVLIARNTFRNCQDETIILKGDQGHLSQFTIENNYLGRPLGRTNPFPVQISGSEPCTGCTLRFNSLPVDAQLAFLNSGSPANPNSNSVVYGNITLNHPDQCAISLANSWTWDSNLFLSGGGTCGTNAATTNDPYRDSSTLDLRLVPGSSAINQFTGAQSVPATDINGTRRPQGRRPDAGAFEVR